MDDIQHSNENEPRMPLWRHLDELRNRLIRCLVVLTLGTVITYAFADPLVYFLEKPLIALLPKDEPYLYFTGLADKFMVYLKVSVLAAVALTAPFLLYEVWRFVAPGLYKSERRLVVPFMFLGSIAFLLGIAFGYFVVIPYGYDFLLHFGSPREKALITLAEYFSLTTKLLLALGLVFELPVVIVLLGLFGVVDADDLVQFRKYAFVGSAVLGAIITPTTDAFTMCLVTVPLYLLYEVSIVGVRFFAKRKQ
ncbi:MAG: twin-arginine translocase subunit TatC [Deltaproteobacteria bacterium]|nr:twin-arginine translocase subunit TatC [Deltaproteobacteria bacterium]